MASLDDVLERLDEIKTLLEEIKSSGTGGGAGSGNPGVASDPGTYFRAPHVRSSVRLAPLSLELPPCGFHRVDPALVEGLDAGETLLLLRLARKPG